MHFPISSIILRVSFAGAHTTPSNSSDTSSPVRLCATRAREVRLNQRVRIYEFFDIRDANKNLRKYRLTQNILSFILGLSQMKRYVTSPHSPKRHNDVFFWENGLETSSNL